jgi:hypothetical protein
MDTAHSGHSTLRESVFASRTPVIAFILLLDHELFARIEDFVKCVDKLCQFMRFERLCLLCTIRCYIEKGTVHVSVLDYSKGQVLFFYYFFFVSGC